MGDVRGRGPVIAYSTFRRGRRQPISAVFTPLIGEKRANGRGGPVIDILPSGSLTPGRHSTMLCCGT